MIADVHLTVMEDTHSGFLHMHQQMQELNAEVHDEGMTFDRCVARQDQRQTALDLALAALMKATDR